MKDHLTAWRMSGDRLQGTLAADALDQALGLLEELAGGTAASLLATVQALLSELPPPIE